MMNHRGYSAVAKKEVKTLNVYEMQTTHPFVKTFLFGKNEDPVKERFPILKDYAKECKISPQMAEKRFLFVRQRYGMCFDFSVSV